MKNYTQFTTQQEWIDFLWWDRFYGVKLQALLKQGELFPSRGKKAAVSRIINNAKRELNVLTSQTY